VKGILILLLILCTVALGEWLLHRHDTPSAQPPHERPGCNEADRPSLPCDGVRPS
jgi:hypothetical protein